MDFDIDAKSARAGSDCAKWSMYDDDVIPMFVADMDFPSPPAVVEAIQARAAHGFFGYQKGSPELADLVVERVGTRYNWEISADDIEFSPGLIPSLSMIARMIGQPGDQVLLQPPVYFPFIIVTEKAERVANFAQLTQLQVNDSEIQYEIDFDAFEAAITPQTKLFILCNPHNPVGRVYTRAELERMAEICLRHDLIICSDEIHADLILEGEHIPIASIAPEVAARTLTLMAPSKTYNLPGLSCGWVIAPNHDLLEQLKTASVGLIPDVNIMGYTAAIAAYRHGQPWLDETLDYLRGNRDFLCDYVAEHLPGVRVTRPEGTYLAWLDFSGLELDEAPQKMLLREARVALSDGTMFGPGGEQHARLNFACPRQQLTDALDRIRTALAAVQSA